jgi:hypothetical protein
MIYSRFTGGGFQGITPSFYTSYVTIYRRVLTGNQFSGPLATNVLSYASIAIGWPVSIVAKKGDLEYFPQGETEIGDYRLVCQYKRRTDNTLIIQERDIIVDPDTNSQYRVLWAHDPMNTHQQILADLKFGVTELNLSEQT